MNKKILYAGDTSLTTAAGYLAGILSHHGLGFDYVASDEPLAPAIDGLRHALYIISDFPVNNWRENDFATVLDSVAAGAGLLMIGGWESYHGLGGDYDTSPLSQSLPVIMQSGDDRVNCPQPCLIEKRCDHEILADLPFDRPPGIGGYNLFKVKGDATEILSARHFDATMSADGSYSFAKGIAAPLLVVGEFGSGRVAALATDVAPHWVGGFVDWGMPRISARGPGAGDIEVGSYYAEFFANLVKWCMGAVT